MGKKSRQKDKLYMTPTEWKEKGGYKRTTTSVHRRLPFHVCALSLQPFENPVCTPEGVIFELTSIVPWVQAHKRNPVTGEPLALKSLLRLHFQKNDEGQFVCPATYKVFSDHTHIVAVRTSGRVYSWEAVSELNIKAKNWTDLVSGEAFTRDDIIQLQDPNNESNRDIDTFFYRKLEGAGAGDSTQARAKSGIRVNAAARRVLSEVEAREATRVKLPAAAAARTGRRVEGLASGNLGASFTSTAVQLTTADEGYFTSAADERQRRYKYVREGKKKGYVRLHTSHGDLNVQLHCDLAPRTCENFLTHCANGYYDKVTFHRNIPGFMVQGGDPTGTGRGGESIWGEAFPDEFHASLSHAARGTLSMANAGPDSNGSQFFITYKEVPHLDEKHTVFGVVVGGMAVLDALESVPTDDVDRPTETITIHNTPVFVNPFLDPVPDAAEERRRAEEAAAAKRAEERARDKQRGAWFSNPGGGTGGGNGRSVPAVGRYLPTTTTTTTTTATATAPAATAPTATTTTAPAAGAKAPTRKRATPGAAGGRKGGKKKKTGGRFGDFSSW